MNALKKIRNVGDRPLALGVGHLMMIAMVIFSVVMYKERILFLDAPYYAFQIIINEDFFIAHHRYINYLNQWLPLLAIKLGLPLKWVLMLFSFSFALFYYVIFFVVGHTMKNHRAALMLGLALLMSSRLKHYMAVTENTNTVAMAFLYIGWITQASFWRGKLELRSLGIALGLLLLCMGGHPIIYIPLLAVTAFFVVLHRQLDNPRAYLLMGLVLVAVYLRSAVMPASGYEDGKMMLVDQAFNTLDQHWDAWSHYLRFSYIDRHFEASRILYILVVIGLVLRKRISAAIFSAISMLAMIVVILVMCRLGDKVNYQETYHIYMGLLASMALLGLWMFWRKGSKWIIAAAFLVFSIQWVKLMQYGQEYTDRLHYLNGLTDRAAQAGQQKTLYPTSKMEWDVVKIPWGVPFNTILYSSIHGPSKTVYLYRDFEIESGVIQPNHSGFYGAHFNTDEFTLQQVNASPYFDLDTGAYFFVEK